LHQELLQGILLRNIGE